MPKNTIVLINNYYSINNPLTEGKIKLHYSNYKTNILKETKNKPIVLFIGVGINNLIVKRNINNKEIVLTSSNYDHIMHGRVVSIAMEFGSITNLWFIDIDPGKNVKWRDFLDIVELVLDAFNKKYEEGEAKLLPKIYSTSRGFHIVMEMKNSNTVKNIQEEIYDTLVTKIKHFNNVLINKKRTNENQIILDLSPLNKRGSRVVPFGLNRNGLMCMDITRRWKTFKFSNAII